MTVIQFLKSNHQDSPQTALEELVRHHLLIVGQTGSGKTTTTLALLNDLQKTAASAIILDPTGEYSTLITLLVKTATLMRDAGVVNDCWKFWILTITTFKPNWWIVQFNH